MYKKKFLIYMEKHNYRSLDRRIGPQKKIISIEIVNRKLKINFNGNINISQNNTKKKIWAKKTIKTIYIFLTQ